MKNLLKHKNIQERDIIYSRLCSNDKDFKFLKRIKNITNKKLFVNIIYKNISNTKINQKQNKEKSLFIKIEFIFYKLIISLLILNVFKLNCLNSIISKDSTITLKISQSLKQKIFNQGTKPDEILIDGLSQSFTDSYNLNSTNIVTLIRKKI